MILIFQDCRTVLPNWFHAIDWLTTPCESYVLIGFLNPFKLAWSRALEAKDPKWFLKFRMKFLMYVLEVSYPILVPSSNCHKRRQSQQSEVGHFFNRVLHTPSISPSSSGTPKIRFLFHERHLILSQHTRRNSKLSPEVDFRICWFVIQIVFSTQR